MSKKLGFQILTTHKKISMIKSPSQIIYWNSNN